MDTNPYKMPQTIVRATADRPAGFVGIVGVNTASPTIVKAMAVWQIILVRLGHLYFDSYVGILLLDGLGAIDAGKQGDVWQHLWHIAGFSLAPTFVGLVKNVAAYFKRLDETHPQWGG